MAGAVLLRRTSFPNGVRIDDSKRLTPRARLLAFREILANAEVGVGIISPAEIDARNIFHASFEAMRQAVLHLPRAPWYLLIDGPWELDGLDVPMHPVVHGDARSLSIACASIVAKVVRDHLMTWYDGRHPAYGFARHKGYPTAAHLAALAAHGPSPIHRYTFSPVAHVSLATGPAAGDPQRRHRPGRSREDA